MADSSNALFAPVSTSSATLVETGSVAKEQNTGDLYPVKAVQQDILIDARGYVPTTESLAVALRATMTTTTGRQPIIIPGVSKLGGIERKEALSKSRHLSPILRTGIPLGAIVAFLLFSLFSLGPLADGYAKIPIVSDAIQWVHDGSTNWSLLIGDHAPIAQIAPPSEAGDTGLVPASDYVVIARQAANSAGIPPNYFVLQIRQESNFNPNAVSPAGAVGIAQFLPSTAATLGVNPYDPISSLYGAARYMASLDKSCSGDYAKALAAYNAGPPAVTRAVNSGGANWLAYMPAETQNYVHTIMG